MGVLDLDFGDGVVNQTNIDTPKNDTNVSNDDDVSQLNGTSTSTDVTGLDNNTNDQPDNQQPTDNQNTNNNNGSQTDNNDKDDNSSTGELTEGTVITVDDVDYTIDANGNVVDKDGKVFKEAKDVKDWIASFEKDETPDSSIAAVQAALGVDVTDENGNPVDFTDDAEGIASYVKSVIDLKSKDIRQGAINNLFAANPMLQQFIDYCQLNGGDPRGFGEIPDRSGVQLEKDNEAQQEAIIRLAAKEFGNKSISDSYIKYLKESGALYDEAKSQLEAIVQADKTRLHDLQERAKQQREQEQKEIVEYWNGVNNIINSRKIAGYKIPETFVKKVDGKQITLTPNDFYNYLSKAVETDDAGSRITQYQKDLNNLSDEDALNRELLEAWLMFTGGSYKDLVDMAIKENEVKRLKLTSKQNTAKPRIKIDVRNKDKMNINDILL